MAPVMGDTGALALVVGLTDMAAMPGPEPRGALAISPSTNICHYGK
jgi:hypothetical protein